MTRVTFRVPARPKIQVPAPSLTLGSNGSVYDDASPTPNLLGTVTPGGDFTVTSSELQDSAGNTLGYILATQVGTAPDGTYQLKDTSGNLISAGSIRSGQLLVQLQAPDGTYQLKDTAGNLLGSGNIRSGQLLVQLIAPDGSVTFKNSNNTTIGSKTVKSGETGAIGNIIDTPITRDGVAYGNAPSGEPFDVTSAASTPPSLSVASTNYTPVHDGPTYTVTASATGLTPTSYTFIYPIDNAGNKAITTQAGNALAITPRGLGSQIIRVIATNGVTSIEGEVTVTVSYARVTSLYTDGVNDFARGNWRIGSAQGRALSVSFWLKYISGTAFFIRIGEPVDGQNYIFMIQPSSTGPALNFRIGDGVGFFSASAPITANVWNHITLTYRCPGWSTANPVGIYVNGSTISTTTSVSSRTQVVKPSIQLGIPDFGGAASIKIHGLSIYEDCLSAAQAIILRNGGTPLSIPSLSGVEMSEYFGGQEAAQVPSTNTSAPWTEVKGINGGCIYCNNSFASPYGLVTDIP